MGTLKRFRFSISSLLVLVAIVALGIWFLRVPDRAAVNLSEAIENLDHEKIRAFCTPDCAERIIYELEHHPVEKLYTPVYFATIRHSLPKYVPNPKCKIRATNWNQVFDRSRELRLETEGNETLIVTIRGAKALDVEQEARSFLFTLPILR